MLGKNTKTVVWIAVILLLLYVLYKNKPEGAITNDGELQMDAVMGNVNANRNLTDELPLPSFMDVPDMSLEEEKKIKAIEGEIDEVSAERGPVDSEKTWKDYFNETREIISTSRQRTNDSYKPNLETSTDFASYTPKKITLKPQQDFLDPLKERDLDESEMFNVDALLPQEKHNWFDVIEDTLPVKGRNLINLQQYIGVNTTGSSKKNASQDLRGNVATPKFPVSPWLNSTIDPDYNIKSWC